MRKKILSIVLLALLSIAGYIPTASAHNAGFPAGYNPNILVIDTIGEPESLDPAWAYDTASAEVIQNVYDGLIMYTVDMIKGPYEAGLVDQFDPKLATSWSYASISETSPEGLTWVLRVTFTIRTDVKFHDGSVMTPEDVEYSFERVLVQDRDGGPQWMLYEPLLNTYSADTADASFGNKIDHAIESDSTTVWFNLAKNFPKLTFLQILSGTWSSVVKKSWAVTNGDFDGDWTRSWADIVTLWHNPPVSKLEGKGMMGAGPYKLTNWIPGSSWQIDRFADYWDGWPARVQSGSSERIGGYISTIIWYLRTEWVDRRSRFLAGDSDFTDVDRMYRDQALGQPGIRCFYPYSTLSVTGLFFTFNITTTSPYLGVSGGLPPGTFSESGIPPNIFGDINVRLGFAYAFDYNGWLTAAYLGEGEQPSDPIIEGLLYDNLSQEKYYFDKGAAATYLIGAWGGALWSNGMKFTVTYNIGNVARQTAAEMIAKNINSLNAKFHVDTMGVDWGSTYLPQMVAGELPLFIIGWLADYPDPHNFAHPFMHSQGTFAAWQKYKNPVADSLIEQGIATPDGPARQQIYYDLQALYHNDVPGVTIVQALGRHFERDWVRSWRYHRIAQDMYYHFWKAQTHFGDANNDGAVDLVDRATLSAHWTTPAGPLGYNVVADINGGVGGTTGSSWGLVMGIPDGKVDVIDLSLVSAYWDTGPTGPLHP